MQVREVVIFDHTSSGLRFSIWESDLITRYLTVKILSVLVSCFEFQGGNLEAQANDPVFDGREGGMVGFPSMRNRLSYQQDDNYGKSGRAGGGRVAQIRF